MTRDYLDRLARSGRLANNFRFHIVTSTCEATIERLLSEADMLQYFGGILGYATHASKRTKCRRLAQRYNFALHDTLFVTDTLGDLKEAAKVGLPSIAVTFGHHPREILSQGKSRAIVDTCSELIEAVHAC